MCPCRRQVATQADFWPPRDFGNASVGMGSYAADGHYSTRGPCVRSTPGTSPACRMVTTEAELQVRVAGAVWCAGAALLSCNTLLTPCHRQAALANGTLWSGGEGYVGATNQYALYREGGSTTGGRARCCSLHPLPLLPSTI